MNMRFYLALACLLMSSVPTWAQIPFYAILLPETGMQAGAAEAVRTGLIAAYYADTEPLSQRPALQFYDTDAAPIEVVYQQAVQEGALAVMGPLAKDQVTQLLHQRTSFPVPTLLLNRSDDPVALNNVWELSLSPEDEIPALVQAAHQAGLHNMAILSDPDAVSQLHARHLADAWQASGGEITVSQTLHAHGHILEDMRSVLFQPAPLPVHKKHHRHRHEKKQPLISRPLDGIFLATGSTSGAQIRPTLLHLNAPRPIFALSTAVNVGKGHADLHDLQGVIYSEIPWLAQSPDDIYRLLTAVDPMQGTAHLRLVALGLDAWQLMRRGSASAWPWAGRTGLLKPEGSLLVRQPSLSRINDSGWELLP